MHEVSIAQSIADTVRNEMDETDLERVREIHVKIGVLSGIERKLLEHVFSFVIEGTALEKTVLTTELVDVKAICENCQEEFVVKNYCFICPVCNTPSSNVTEGNELTICKIILEEPIYEKTNE